MITVPRETRFSVAYSDLRSTFSQFIHLSDKPDPSLSFPTHSSPEMFSSSSQSPASGSVSDNDN